MDSDRIKLNMNRDDLDIISETESRLNPNSEVHPEMLKIESMLIDILNMMHSKTNQYGGNRDAHRTVHYRAWKAMFQGVERKADRLESLTIKALEGDKEAQEALIDTYIDTAGYSLFALLALVGDFQK
jgi:hypothetical protein